MGDFEEQLSIRKLANAFRLIQSNNEKDLEDGLSIILTILTYGDPDFLTSFPTEQFCYRITKILLDSENEKIVNLGTACISLILEVQNRSIIFLLSNKVLQIFANLIKKAEWSETVSNCISALNFISNFKASDIGEMIGIGPILEALPLLDIPTQRKAMEIIQQITSTCSINSQAAYLPKLQELCSHNNLFIQKSAIKSINNISCHVNPDLISDDTITFLCSSSKFITSLIYLSKKMNFISKIISSNIDFKTLLTEAKTSDKQSQILILMLNLLPYTSKMHNFECSKHNRPAVSSEFAKSVQPLLLHNLIENNLCPKLILLSLASTLESNLFDLTEEIIVILKNLSRTLCSYVLLILTYYENSSLLASSRILESMNFSTIQPTQRNWFYKTYKNISNKVSIQIQQETDYSLLETNEIINLILNNNISKLKFLKLNLDQFLNYDYDSLPIDNIITLMDFMVSLLSFISFPNDFNQESIRKMIKYLSKISTFITLLPNNDRICISLPLHCSVRTIEGWYNEHVNGYGAKKLIETLNKNNNKSFLRSIINIEDFRQISTTQMSILYRAFLGEEYEKIYITYKDISYDINSSLFNIRDKNDLISPNKIYIHKGEINTFNDNLNYKIDVTLEGIIKIIKLLSKYTKIKFNSTFNKKIHDLLFDPFNSLSENSIAMKVIYSYPLIFPFDLRLFTFYLRILEPKRSILKIIKEFNIQSIDLTNVPQTQTFKVHVSRDSLFNDGCNIFNYFSQNLQKLEIIFNDEPGIGVGPTREFFTLFSHELCLNERKIFKSDTIKPGLAIAKKGMFFSPLASDNAVKLLGRFIAKSIQMECLIDINFNPAIFKFIRGDNVDVWEVDEDLARALGRPEGLIGLPFNYPGLDFPLKPSDSDDSFDVTEENLDEFVSLIKEYTCGSKLDHLRNAFIEGFSEIFPFSYLDIFNENEICRIIRGDGPKFTYKDLEENVEISHGYERDSPQIAMLFETLSELEEDDQHLLIQFITGYYQLPIGGLAALDPKLTIAKRSFDDENTDPNTQLPSVMTCTNYFKVPSYTNKDIMREKILLAIHEGQDSFQLS